VLATGGSDADSAVQCSAVGITGGDGGWASVGPALAIVWGQVQLSPDGGDSAFDLVGAAGDDIVYCILYTAVQTRPKWPTRPSGKLLLCCLGDAAGTDSSWGRKMEP
jgi:hypothetical protein